MDAHILIVDDESRVTNALRRTLAYEGYQVSTAADGARALEIARTKSPDLIILDLMLPGIDGLEVCRRLRGAGNDVAVLMLTARDTVADRVIGLEIGADDYLVYTLLNNDMGSQHIIQAASPLTPIEQSLSDLRTLLLRGAALVLTFALVGGWFISWGVLHAVRRITRTARTISAARDLRKRIPMSTKKGRREGGNSRPHLTLQHIAPAQIYGDRDLLKQALIALLDNALKYTPAQEHVSLSLMLDHTDAVVKVSDTGIGIAEEDLPHIFERFYRANHIQTRDRDGSGLGLAIVQSIVRDQGGTIEVESVQGAGSVFTLRLPLVEGKA